MRRLRENMENTAEIRQGKSSPDPEREEAGEGGNEGAK